MKWIKDKLIEYQLNEKLKTSESQEVKIPEQLRCIGVLANSESDFIQTKEIIRNIWQYQIRIIGLFYSEEPSRHIEAFSSKHFSIWGLPTEYFNAFKSEKMDFILVPSLELNPYLRYLLLSNESGFKIGFYSSENKPFLDLMLGQEDEDLPSNILNLLEYLKKIKEAC